MGIIRDVDTNPVATRTLRKAFSVRATDPRRALQTLNAAAFRVRGRTIMLSQQVSLVQSHIVRGGTGMGGGCMVRGGGAQAYTHRKNVLDWNSGGFAPTVVENAGVIGEGGFGFSRLTYHFAVP